MPATALILGKGEEEGRSVQAIVRTKLDYLFRRSLVAKNRYSRITGYKFDEQRYQGDDGPDHEQQDAQPSK